MNFATLYLELIGVNIFILFHKKDWKTSNIQIRSEIINCCCKDVMQLCLRWSITVFPAPQDSHFLSCFHDPYTLGRHISFFSCGLVDCPVVALKMPNIYQ